MDRRRILQSTIAAALLPWHVPGALASTEGSSPSHAEHGSEISIILPRKPSAFPPEEGLDRYNHRLSRAVLDLIRDHYAGRSMPVWDKPPEAVDLETRIRNIMHWVLRLVRQNAGTYFLDPAWIMAQIMRVTYKKPIEAMIAMMARYMRGRNGNILVATAGYNAGLSKTYSPHAVYEPYGLIPNFDETASYVSKIAVNHHEIARRMSAD